MQVLPHSLLSQYSCAYSFSPGREELRILPEARWGQEWGAQRMMNHCHQYHLPFWSPEPLAEGLILFHGFLTTLLRCIDYRSSMYLICTFLWGWTPAKQPWHRRCSRGNSLIHYLPESPCLPLFCFCLFVFMVKILLAMRPYFLFIHSKVHTL